MKPKAPRFSFEDRAAEKAAARERDEEILRSGEVSWPVPVYGCFP